MEGLQPPQPMSLTGNIAENWKKWHQKFEIYRTASGMNDKHAKVQCCTLLHIIGEDALEVYNNFVFENEADKSDISKILDQFEKHFMPQKNITYERHVFNSRVQHLGEPLDQFVTDLRTKAKTCEYGPLGESLIKDRIVVGICDDQLRARLLQKRNLDLKTAIDMCRATEASKVHLGQLGGNESNIDSINKDKYQARPRNTNKYRNNDDSNRPRPSYGNRNNSDYHDRRNDNTSTTSSSRPSVTNTNVINDCNRCGRTHERARCPAYGQICDKCGKMNHFAKVCRQEMPNKRQHKKTHKIDERTADSDSDLDSEFFVDKIDKESPVEDEWFVNLIVNDRTVRFKLDTGSQCDIIPESVQIKVKGDIERSRSKLITYSGEKITPKGKTVLLCEHKHKYYDITFQVVKGNVTPIIGAKTCQRLGLVKRIEAVDKQHEIIENNPEVFQGLGCLEGKHHIKVKANAVPVVHAPRKVPIALRDKVRKELNRMEKLGVIVRVEEPSEWVSSMVTVCKPGRETVRICLDPKDLNEAIEREHFPMRTIEEVVIGMPNAKIFTTLDANCGYWQIQLDEASSRLCTFNTPHGRFRYTRLPFGIHSAPEVFQRIMTQVFEGIEGVEVIMDDILVWGSNEVEHDRRLEQVLQQVLQKHITLNPQKCKFKQSEVTYIGHVLTSEGLKPDPNKIEAVLQMKAPENKTGLQQALGMINYLAKFIPDMSTKTMSLRKLLEKNVAWHWTEEHDRAFTELKELVTKAPVLRYFDVKKPVKISVDASSTGVGGVLLQNDQPIAYTSKAFNSSQQRYAQIEKELAAIVFGCEKFHQYIFGTECEIETDHKPLEYIFRKPLAAAPLRLQKMILKLQKYCLKVTYKKGKDLYVADALSRNHLTVCDDIVESEEEISISMVKLLQVSKSRQEEMKIETERDETLQKLSSLIQNGWPQVKQDVDASVRSYWEFRDELAVEDGLIFRNNRVVVPTKMRSLMLEKIHESHQGIEKSKRFGRDILFWPGMSAQIADMVGKCSTCNTYRQQNTKEPLIGHAIPQRPWQKVGMDLFELHSKQYLIIVDYHSNFFEVNNLHDTRSTTIIKKCKQQFSRYGIPDTIVSDNGPQFSSQDFKLFSKQYKFTHTTSSPRYPQSNGKAEKAVQIAKNLLKKAKADGSDPHLALLDYRNTPRDGLPSPAQILMGRRTQTLLPTTAKLLRPKTIKGIAKRLEHNQQNQKHYYDRSSKPLSKLQQGDTVRIRTDRSWKPAVVVRCCAEPRSYIVKTSSGQLLRRNRRDLIKTSEQQPIDDIEDIDPPYPEIGIDHQNTVVPPHIPRGVPYKTKTRAGRITRLPAKFRE